MKITKISIQDFQQFQNFELDLTYPENHPKAGKPLDKVCFIGGNGAGKSTLLRFIYSFIREDIERHKFGSTMVEMCSENESIYTFPLKGMNGAWTVDASIQENENWIQDLHQLRSNSFIHKYHKYRKGLNFVYKSNISIYSPAESEVNMGIQVSDVPDTQLNQAMALFKEFPNHHLISTQNLHEYWNLLIFLIKKRESDLKKFEEREENLDKTIRQVRAEFDKTNPDILQEIAKLWNKILDKAGLEFDIENASKPIQLMDNLKAYIKTKNSNLRANNRVSYNKLSTGIRNFIFRLGHIFTLYFNREIKSGILLIDEPENSLFPDFLYDLVDTYLGIIQNTQLFMATHSPIIAAQFEPCERVILEFGENGKVYARKGNSPAGDDPNNLLIRDFGVRNILGKEGVKKWERYIELKILIKHETDTTVKQQLMQEFMKIGQAYNFPAP